MRNNNYHLSATGCLILFLFLLLPINVYSSQLFHTIQISSFSSVPDAQEQFDSIVNKLDETQLDNLRIEKIGKFYSVRLGKFMDNTSAERFFMTIKPKLPNAAVMKAYIKKERIVKLYSASSSVSIKGPGDGSFSTPVLDKVTPKTTKKADKKVSGVPLKENIKNIEALVRKNDYTSALDLITAEITEHPDHPDLNAWLGMVLLKMDKPLDALEYLEKATELSPNVSDYHNGLGYSFFFLNRFDEAIDEFNKAISLDPGHIDALTGLCIAYAKNDNKEKAMDIYHKIKSFDNETSKKLLTIIKK